jgi:hypothetical protein
VELIVSSIDRASSGRWSMTWAAMPDYRHDAHGVGDGVVQLSGDAQALRGHRPLGVAASALVGIRGPQLELLGVGPADLHVAAGRVRDPEHREVADRPGGVEALGALDGQPDDGHRDRADRDQRLLSWETREATV